MKILKTESKQCISCMEEHDVEIVEAEESGTFKGEKVDFIAIYEFCPNSEEYSETEEMMRSNSSAQKDAYRSKVGLLTSREIKSIREKYGMGQKEFAEVLGWGMATIARYETQQVQDRVHDDMLRKLDSEPKWFLEILERAKDKIGVKYVQYYKIASELLRKKTNPYVWSFTSSGCSVDELSLAVANVNFGIHLNHYCVASNLIQQENSDAA